MPADAASLRILRRLALILLGSSLVMLPPRLALAADAPAPTSSGAPHLETATLGMGCFWCAQALFERFTGVTQVVCGYAGGHTVNPTYEDVCGDQTGHAETVQITFDPAKISYAQLLEIFWDVHDPTTLDRQGDDEGTQYRSIILYETPEQRKIAEESKKAEEAKLGRPVTTEIVPLTAFYRAEEYHQDYFKKNPHAPYCAFVISPKVQKLEAHLPPGVKLGR